MYGTGPLRSGMMRGSPKSIRPLTLRGDDTRKYPFTRRVCAMAKLEGLGVV